MMMPPAALDPDTCGAFLNSLPGFVFTAHIVIAEQSPIRKFLLFIFARYLEVPLLKGSYYLLRGKWKHIGSVKWIRAMMAYFLVRPFSYLGDTGKPMPYGEVLSYIDAIEGPLAVGPCRCRIGHCACAHPLETDIVFRTGYDAWTKAFPRDYRTITKAEAKDIVTKCHRLGMMQMVFVHCPANLYNEYVICNCCTCGCVVYILNRDLGQLNYPLIDGYYMAVTDTAKCKGCAACVEVCPFGARELTGGKSMTAHNCYGCGLCFYRCPEKAIAMKTIRERLPPRRDDGHWPEGYRPRLYRQHEPHRE